MEPPSVSVVCPVHDTDPDRLRAAVRSALGEPGVAEVVVVDDASRREDTRAAVRGLAEEGGGRVVPVTLGRNGGPGPARNAGVLRARSAWIGFVDSDDLWLPGRGAAFAALIARHPEAVWIGGRHRWRNPGGGTAPCPSPLDEPGLLRPPTPDDASGPERAAVAEGPALTARFLGPFCLHLGACLVRRDALPGGGGEGRPPFHESYMIGEDMLLFMRLSARHPLHLLDRVVYEKENRAGTLSNSAVALRLGDARMLRAARRDPALAAIRRPLRWALYGAEKRLALSNALRGRRLAGAWHALRALAVDPREVGEFLHFLRATALAGKAGAADPAALRERLRRYSAGVPFGDAT